MTNQEKRTRPIISHAATVRTYIKEMIKAGAPSKEIRRIKQENRESLKEDR